MRIRQVKPAFWSDRILAGLDDETRLFYIGLWMLADDHGWLRWDAAEVAGELYRYAPVARRERAAERRLAALDAAGRVIAHDCGHVEIPRLREHQRFSSPEKQVKTFRLEHERGRCPHTPAGTRGSPPTPADPRNGTERNGTEREREGTERNVSARASGGALTWEQRVEATLVRSPLQ